MSVPKLDLAPKLKRPLSILNPLDYLRLLYWLFYFPQGLKWYLDNFIYQYTPDIKIKNAIRFSLKHQLVLQNIILIFCTNFIIFIIFELLSFANYHTHSSWYVTKMFLLSIFAFSTVFSIGFGYDTALSLIFIIPVILLLTIHYILVAYLTSELFGIISSIFVRENITIAGIASISYLVSVRDILGANFELFLICLSGITTLIVFSDYLLVMEGKIKDKIKYVERRFLFFFIIVILSIFLSVDTISKLFTLLLYLLAFFIVSIRPDSHLVSIIMKQTLIKRKSFTFSHITLIPVLNNHKVIHNWLMQDWETGISNVNTILKYTLQYVSVFKSFDLIDISFKKSTYSNVVWYVNKLAERPYDWILVGFASFSLSNNFRLNTFRIYLLIYFLLKNPSKRINPSLDTPFHSTAAGFWYLHEQKPDKATEAFAVVRDLLYGEEVFILAQTLSIFQQVEEAINIANLTIPNFPTENLLRPDTWQVMNSLGRVVEDIKLIRHSASRNTKSFAYSRAIGELTEVIDNKNNIPEAERELIVDIANTWKQSLERIGKDIGNVTITQPVNNPYIIGNPVTGSLFVGREDILRQLEELWITGNQLQSVVLYGHRRMGKTSILVSVAQATGAEIKVIYINLQRLGAVSQGVAEVLMAISDEIATSLNIDSPEDDDFLQLPQRTFERYLKQVIATMAYRGLIIALDEFETIEELIQKGQIDPAFMGFLRGLVQMNPSKIAFAFAGLHTLEEMTADYFEPFFASVIPIRVSFLNSGATKTILANPVSNIPPFPRGVRGDQTFPRGVRGDQDQNPENSEFLLDYTGEALDLIYSLTAGQPYLVQLIGFQLVRNYNDRVFEQGKHHDNTFTLKDIDAVINPKFFQQGRYYFEGVWGQAAQDAPGQQEIITALAPYPQGLTKDTLATETGLDAEIMDKAIAILIRHDVIKKENDNYRIIVELFRRWVIMKVN